MRNTKYNIRLISGRQVAVLSCLLSLALCLLSAAAASSSSDCIPGGCFYAETVSTAEANSIKSAPLAAVEPAAAGQMQYVDIDTLIVIYTHYYKDSSTRMDLSAADIETLKAGVEKSKKFFWRSSKLKHHVRTDYLVIDRTLTLADMWQVWSGLYWLNYPPVQTDLRSAGVPDNKYSVVLVLYAFKNSTGAGAAYGGATYGVNTILGKAAYISCPLAWGLNCYDVVTHEYLHALDSIFTASGNPGGNDIPNVDQWGLFWHPADCLNHYYFLATDTLDPSCWFSLNSKWRTTRTAADSDNDGVPDSGELPITEAALLTDPNNPDTDGDGLSDLGELGASYYSESDPLKTDSDGDGLSDGSDAYPLYYCSSDYIGASQPEIDGVILAGEYTQLIRYNTQYPSVIYASFSTDKLYIAIDQSSIREIELNIDAHQDGWEAQGVKNYRLSITPLANNAVTVTGANYDGWPPWEGIDVSAITAKCTSRTGGCVVELAIPASVFPPCVFGDGSSIRMTFYGWNDQSSKVNVFNGLAGAPAFITFRFDSSFTDMKASNPVPANGASNVDAVSADLSWTAGIGATSHDIYFGTTNSPLFAANQTSTVYDLNNSGYDWVSLESLAGHWLFDCPPGDCAGADLNSDGTVDMEDFAALAQQWMTESPILETGRTYYWRIDELNSNGTVVGGVWSFTTAGLAPESLVSHWKLDETSGTEAADSTGKGHTGTLIEGTANSLVWSAGHIGGALSFDGDGPAGNANSFCHVSVPTEGMTVASGTVALWANLASSGPNNYSSRNNFMYLFSAKGIVTNDRIYISTLSTDLGLDIGIGNVVAGNTAILTRSSWYHIALTWGSNVYTLYVNGQSVKTGSITTNPAVLSAADIGNKGESTWNQSFHGLIDDVRFYNVTLTAEDVTDLAGQ